jgi:hypothetical protein
VKIPSKPTGRKALPFFWWRRFKTHKFLPYKTNLLDKIKNGDFEYSPFFEQANWELHWMKIEQDEFINNYKGKNPLEDKLYNDIEIKARKRYNKLFADGMNDENLRINNLISNLSKLFKIKISQLKNILNTFNGTTEDLYFYIKNLNS